MGRKPASSAKERNKQIVKVLQERRTMRISEFQEYLGVSDMTIRRSLNELAAEGLIKRMHGGATVVDVEDDYSFAARSRQNQSLKTILAKKAVELIPENSNIYLDAGSTCFTLARMLGSSGKKGIVITDSILILQELQGSPNIEAVILGGSLSNDNVTVDGALTAETAGKISVNLCIFSANAFNVNQMENQFLAGALTKKILIERATKSIFIADSGKFNRQSCFRFSGWEDVDILISDSGLPGEAVRAIEAKNVEVHLVDVAG